MLDFLFPVAQRLRAIERRLDAVFTTLRGMACSMEKIMATQAELVTQLNSVKDALNKIGAETTALLTKIDELKAVIAAGGTVTPELQAAVDAVAAQAKVVDDLVPDVVP